jgi:hypothetical protein
MGYKIYAFAGLRIYVKVLVRETTMISYLENFEKDKLDECFLE